MSERSVVRDLMTVGVSTCSPETPVVDIVRLLLDKDLESVVVLDSHGHAVGIVGRDEMIQAYSRDDVTELKAQNIMHDEVPHIPPSIPLVAAAQIMRDLGVRQVYLMHHADGVIYPAAFLSYTHLLRHLAGGNEDDLDDLGIAATREAPLETFIRKRDMARRHSQVYEDEE